MRKNLLRIYLHLVWATWDRQPLITEDIERDLHRYLSCVCEDDECRVLAIGGMPDHVHMLVALATTITVADLVQHLKGGSSRFVSNRLSPGAWYQWQGHYGALSVSPNDKDRIIAYIRNQKEHHANGRLWLAAEQTFEEKESISYS